MLSSVCGTLRKDESKWKSTECLDLLRWKNQKNISLCNTKDKRKKQWNKLVNEMTTLEQSEIDDLSTPERQSSNASHLCLSRGHDPNRCDENEHVDNDENFGVNDVTWCQVEFNKALKDQEDAMALIIEQSELVLARKSQQEKRDCVCKVHCDSFEDDHCMF